MEMEKIEVGHILTLIDDEDQEQEVEVLGTLSVSGTDYAAVGFVEDIQEETEEEFDVFFLKVENDDQLIVIDNFTLILCVIAGAQSICKFEEDED